MKKSLFLFTVMLASFLASFTNAWADTDPSAEFVPSDGTASYEYYVRLSRKFNDSDAVGRFYLQKKLGSDSNNLLFSSTEEKLIVTLKEFSNSDDQLRYYVVPTNAVTAEGTATEGIFVTEATSEGTKILLKSTSASTSNTQGWYIQARDKSSYFSSSDYPCLDIIEHVYTISVGNSNDSQGWNIHWPLDNGTTVELYKNTDGNCALYFEPANATAVKAALQEQIDEAESYLGTVGYPSETSTEGIALKTAIENINNFNPTSSDFATVKAALITALTNYEASTSTGINLPEDGKVYKIAAVFDDNSEYALYYNPNGKMYNDNTQMSSTGCIDGVKGVDNVNKTGYFFCHKVGEQYLFVNKDGYYLTWLDPNAGTSDKYHTGYTDSYDSQKNLWTISKAASSGSNIASTTTAASVFGKVQMQAIGDGSSTYYLLARIPGRSGSDGNTMDFVSGSSSDIYYDNYTSSGSTTVRRTHAFKFYEVSVDEYCTLNLKAAYRDNTTEDCYLATYSTPFPVSIPDNMEAYYAPSYADGQTNVSLQKIDGDIIPKGTGVVVKSPTAGKFNPVPATENGTKPSANALLPTGGNGTTVESGTKAYILINANPARFNLLTSDTNNRTIAPFRAYLVPNTTESDTPQQAVGISFGSTLSGITSVTNQNDTVNSPVYDLSGRIVKQPVRGIYIKNGKKFIVK